MLKLRLIIALFIIISTTVFGQKPQVYNKPNQYFHTAYELFNKQKFGQAQEYFNKYLSETKNTETDFYIQSLFYSAICAQELYHPTAEKLLTQFIEKYPENPLSKKAAFYLGKNHFYKKKYKEAIEQFNQINLKELTSEDIIELHFKLGYAYFMENDLKNAKLYLSKSKEENSAFKPAANYYYAHIAYQEKNYETALKSFLSVEKDETFGPIAPYYIAQIYYLQNKYDKVIEYAPSLLNKKDVKREEEINRIIAESYYNLNQYAKCIPFFEKFIENSSLENKFDSYKLGFAYYKTTKYDLAIKLFSNCIKEKDSLAQNALYIMGDCYIKNNNKPYAKNAYQAASQMKFNPTLEEDALFNYAKLTYDLSFNPYNEAINAFKNYIEKYPNSKQQKEANNYLLNLYLTTNNFKEALLSFQNIEKNTEQLKSAYQYIAYNRAVELFNEGSIDDAIHLFEEAGNLPYKKKLQSMSYYWLGEAHYRKTEYKEASDYYQKFLYVPGAINLDQYDMTAYNIGYCYFNQKNYSEASTWFRKYLKNPEDKNSIRIPDASLRLGDCYFLQKEYEVSYNYYSQASEVKYYDTDYALYQKALVAGLMNKFNEKTSILNTLNNTYPKSTYITDSKFELGKTYQLKSEDEKAILIFEDIYQNHKTSILAKSALSQIGLIQYKNENLQEALLTFKKVVNEFPGTTESNDALKSIQNIYVDMNKVDEFFAYVKELPNSNISDNTQDSVSYQAAINRYLDGDCNNAINGFENYLKKFPNGNFNTNAHYYLAECAYKQNLTDVAINAYEYVVQQAKNTHTENSLKKISYIYFNDKKDYAKALKNYLLLEEYAEDKTNILIARTGQMRSAYKNKDYAQTIKVSKKLLTTPKITKELEEEAQLNIALSAYEIDSLNLAKETFRIIANSTKSEAGATAKYFSAEILHNEGYYTETEKLLFELINQVPSYDFWIAKAFILLADNYVKLNNNFQAKHTLKSIIDNYEGEDLVTIAKQKLNNIIEAEQKQKELEAKQAEEEKKRLENEQNIQFNKEILQNNNQETIPNSSNNTQNEPTVSPDNQEAGEKEAEPDNKIDNSNNDSNLNQTENN